MSSNVRGLDEQNLGDLVRQLLSAFGLDDKLTEVRLRQAWYTTVGPLAKKYTKELRIRNKVLYVTLSSAALRYELSLSKDTLLKNLHEEAGVERYLRDIVLR